MSYPFKLINRYVNRAVMGYIAPVVGAQNAPSEGYATYGATAGDGGNLTNDPTIRGNSAQIGSVLNYRTYGWAGTGSLMNPSNPLSSSYDSVTLKGTISVASFQLWNGYNNPVYNAGAITIPNTTGTYYVYCSDQTGQGGSVTYQYTTTRSGIAASDSNVYVGYIDYTAGTGGTGGGGGGGTLPP